MEQTQVNAAMQATIDHMETGFGLIYKLVGSCPNEAHLFASLARVMETIRQRSEATDEAATTLFKFFPLEWVITSYAQTCALHPDAAWNPKRDALQRIMHAEGRRMIASWREEFPV